MDQGFTIFPRQASTFAPQYDLLYYFLTAVTVFFTALIFVLIAYFCLKYRRKENDEATPTFESTRLEIFYTIVPFVIVMVIFFWGTRLYFNVYSDVQDPLNIHVIGKQWMWKVQHMEGRREINELHVPTGRRVQLTMGSQDTIHSFFIPAFRVKQDVVPGRYSTMSFEPTEPGTYHLFCAEYCGADHSRMVGKVIVMTPEDYEAWLTGTVQDDETPVAAGARLFNTLGCLSCHGVEAPSMAGLFGRQRDVVLPSGRTERVIADERYIRESIEYSTAKIVQGYRPIMQSFRGQVTEDQLSQLVAYIRSLKDAKRGQGGDEVQQDQLRDQAQGAVGGAQQGTTSGTPDKTPGGPGSGSGTNRTPQD